MIADIMKIFITGGSGRIGYKFFEYLSKENNDLVCTFMNHKIDIPEARKLDLTNKKDTISLIEKERPELVIHTAALTNVDLCEKYRGLADLQNVEATRNVIEGCVKARSKIIFLSSSFVFSGKKSLYIEEDTPDPINYYGFTKVESEKQIIQSGLDFLILRVDQPYDWIKTWQNDNQVTKVLKALKNGKIYEDVTDWYNNPTFAPNIVEAVIQLVKRGKGGVYNLVGSSYISRYDWSITIADVFSKDRRLIKPINSQKLNLIAVRPNVNMSNKKAERDSGVVLVGIKEGLEKMKSNFKENNF